MLVISVKEMSVNNLEPETYPTVPTVPSPIPADSTATTVPSTTEISPIDSTIDTEHSTTVVDPVECIVDAEPSIAEILPVDAVVSEESPMTEVTLVDSTIDEEHSTTEPEPALVPSTDAESSTIEVAPVEHILAALESGPCIKKLDIIAELAAHQDTPMKPDSAVDLLAAKDYDEDNGIVTFPPIRPASPSLAEKKRLQKQEKAKAAKGTEKKAEEKPKKSRVAMSKADLERLAAKKARQAAKKADMATEI